MVSFKKYRSDEVNYLQADATWHILLTIQAYDETPISDHLFLPIVTLGTEDDKYIPWGDTIPDKKGNYYYTSFSPAGYVMPWIFMKIFQLPVCEKSIYIFNTFLFTISTALWVYFILTIYKKSQNKYWLAMIGLLTYVLAPEVLHGMGIVYWHQSLMQVTLLAQIIAFWQMKEFESKIAQIVFYILALINPYVEWTGFIVNIGFAAAELLIGYSKGKLKKSFIKSIILGCVTLLSFGVFLLHYLLRVDAKSFFQMLKARFLVRGISSSASISRVLDGYLQSMLHFGILLLFLIIWCMVKNKKIVLNKGILMFILAFPVIENFLMKEHALSYSYDRMKGIFVISFIICELVDQILEGIQKRQLVISIIFLLTVCASICNIKDYMKNGVYIWETNYRQGNQALANYINNHYSDSVLGIDNAVRGYMNLLFGRGIYEYTNYETMVEVALTRGKRYVVMPYIENIEVWSYDLGGAFVYDLQTGDSINIVEDSGEILIVVLE